jgi:uncharacterized membrane protein (UPF0182 family)
MATGSMPEFDIDIDSIKSMLNGKIKWILLAVFIIGAFVILSIGRSIISDLLWYGGLGFSGVYVKIITAKIILFIIGFLSAFIILSGFTWISYKTSRGTYFSELTPETIVFTQKAFKISILVFVCVAAIIFAALFSGKWELFLMFMNSTPFSTIDPLFGNNVSLYMFQLPALSFLHGWILSILIVGLLATIAIAFLNFTVRGVSFVITPALKKTVLINVALIVAMIAIGQYISRLNLLTSEGGLVVGATYVDVVSKKPALLIAMIVGLISAILMIAAIYWSNLKFAVAPVGLWIIVTLALSAAWPSMLQQFSVNPNEFVKEKEYIEKNIDFTRLAFGLDSIDEVYFDSKSELTAEILENNKDTVKNIRLWDPVPLADVYRQIQLIRPYYDFNDADVDRYEIDGDYRQVLVSAREVDHEKLADDARTWVNERLYYTHGIGAAMSPATEFTAEGKPVFFAKDIPSEGKIPVSNVNKENNPDILIENPRIYYGEKTNDYVIVNTETQELDYQTDTGDLIKTQYFGSGGIELNSIFKKALYAWQMGDVNIFISDEINKTSRIQYRRQIQERVATLAPFLMLDADPYMVATNEKIYWVQDAYTTSDKFPYSTFTNYENGKFNYIRNSVKIVIDAYSGDVNFYIWDSEDPIIETYRKIFPGLFQDKSLMHSELKDHVRYPQDLFDYQANKYLKYHMVNPEYFYGNEDLWSFPQEKFGQSSALQIVEPYYAIMKLPGEIEEEFVQLIPYTPNNRPNMIGWLAARSDAPNYGKLIAVNFPKDVQVDGPEQIEARIDNDQDISAWFTLRCSEGSICLRGNLFVVPLENSLLYAEPIYIQAEGVSLPELKKVVLASSNKVVMGDSLDEAIFLLTGSTYSFTSDLIKKDVNLEAPESSDTSNPIDKIKQAMENIKTEITSLQQLINSLK